MQLAHAEETLCRLLLWIESLDPKTTPREPRAFMAGSPASRMPASTPHGQRAAALANAVVETTRGGGRSAKGWRAGVVRNTRRLLAGMTAKYEKKATYRSRCHLPAAAAPMRIAKRKDWKDESGCRFQPAGRGGAPAQDVAGLGCFFGESPWPARGLTPGSPSLRPAILSKRGQRPLPPSARGTPAFANSPGPRGDPF